MSDSSSSSSAATATTKKSRGRSKTKKMTAANYELLAKKKPSSPSSSSESSVEAPKSSPGKKKVKESLVKNSMLLMQFLVVALFLVLPITLILCLATDYTDNTWLGFVLHLYISATCVLITMSAFLLKMLLLLPLYLAFFTISFLIWLFCSETVVDQIVTSAGPDIQV